MKKKCSKKVLQETQTQAWIDMVIQYSDLHKK